MSGGISERKGCLWRHGCAIGLFYNLNMTFANLMLITFNQLLFLKSTNLEQGNPEGILGLRAGGHFQSKNLYCRIWALKLGFLSVKLRKMQLNFPKMRRWWGQRMFGIFPKIHLFWFRYPSLILRLLAKAILHLQRGAVRIS